MLVEHSCGQCGMTYAVPQEWLDERKRRGDTFWCPNGHARVFRPTEIETLRKQLAQAQHCCDQERARVAELRDRLQHKGRQVIGYQGALAKEKKRNAPRKMLAAQAGPSNA